MNRLNELIRIFNTISEIEDNGIRKIKFHNLHKEIVKEILERDTKISELSISNSNLIRQITDLNARLDKVIYINQAKDYKIQLENTLTILKEYKEHCEDLIQNIETTIKPLTEEEKSHGIQERI